MPEPSDLRAAQDLARKLLAAGRWPKSITTFAAATGRLARFVLDLPEPAEDHTYVDPPNFDRLALAITMAAGRMADVDHAYSPEDVRKALAADLRAMWPVPHPEPVSPAPGPLSGRTGQPERLSDADDWRGGPVTRGDLSDALAAAVDAIRQELRRPEEDDDPIADLRVALRVALDERFGDYGPARGPARDDIGQPWEHE